jgi:osmoprotectant transport system permease protein
MLQSVLMYIGSHRDRYVQAILAHLGIDAVSLLICIAVALPLGYIGAKHDKFALPMQTITGIIRIIPSIALFLILIPFTGIGAKPAIIALVLLSVPTLLMRTIAGIRSVEPAVIESAQAMGMGKIRIFFEVELPLSMPALLGGLRMAAIEIIASTTIASYVGAGGLGNFIISGLSQYKYDVMLTGALTVAILTIGFDLFLSALQKYALRKTGL